jgi:hypothetical protein
MKKTICKYSFGVGDRFAHQGEAQLNALMKAANLGVEFIPVWNKSNREHTNINSTPNNVRVEADNAVKTLNWKGQYFVDADHINLSNVDWFMDSSDFFTIDVADFIGKESDAVEIADFLKVNEKYLGELQIPGIDESISVNKNKLKQIADKFLFAIKEASVIYKYIEQKKGKGNFIPEVSMDEVEDPQSPVELFFILSALSFYNLPVQTLAPKFTGRFNKGVDYVGDLDLFKKEFEQDLLVVDFAINEFGLPENLKLSIHSGSDKFSIYPIIGDLIKKYDKGIHIKTAGTTWLEEVIGLAIASSDSLLLVKQIYYEAYEKIDELAMPYATVIDIDLKQLPRPDEVRDWSGEKFANSLRHIPGHPDYNLNFRQLLHVAYKLAANRGSTYTTALQQNKQIVAKQVTENIFERHIKRMFKTVK